MKKWLKRTLIAFAVIVLSIVGAIGFVAFQYWYANNYKSHVQTLELTDKNIQFILFTDIAGFGDRAWYVYQLPIGEKVTKNMKAGHNEEGVLFWNYSETGIHYDTPNLEVKKGKFLVFSRGGLYHSLYNIETQKVIINDQSPWASYLQYRESNESSKEPHDHNDTMKELEKWVKHNLHGTIENILKNAI